ncbi:MAG: S-methyl-5-thioribose-1-phosphate isomerase [Gammaproteobacteria bacterium]
MIVDGQHIQSLSYDPQHDVVQVIDQTLLPHQFRLASLASLEQVCHAIRSMQVRGAPLIGVTAAYGLYFALRDDPHALQSATEQLLATRPTAVNLRWALQRVSAELNDVDPDRRARQALDLAQVMEHEDIAICEAIGEQGAAALKAYWQEQGATAPFNILTHCNAGALATVDWGTALAVVYKLAEADVPVHVWVDETRPRNQGAALTCWELAQAAIDHTLVVDNAGGHLMQEGRVDLCLVGADRVTAQGDVCNKIGTYLKALAADDNQLPFYVAVPVSTIDFNTLIEDIPIEERGPEEILELVGIDVESRMTTVRHAPSNTMVSNYGFDITPARLVTGIITEQGVFEASAEGLAGLVQR